MRFITFNAISGDFPFKLVIPVSDIIMAVSKEDNTLHYIMVKGDKYGGLGEIYETVDGKIVRILLANGKEIELLSKMNK